MNIAICLIFFVYSFASKSATCSPQGVQSLVAAVFANLGSNCPLYYSLFSHNAVYYHQHDGFKTKSQLLQNCKNYAAFCPGKLSCVFQQNGDALTFTDIDSSCYVLVKYLWSEIPSKSANLEPHSGWEYMKLIPDNTSSFGFQIQLFSEIETSYSVAFHWDNALDVSVYSWTVNLLKPTASKGECDTPIAPTLYQLFHGIFCSFFKL